MARYRALKRRFSLRTIRKQGGTSTYAERLFKFLLWQRGGCRAYVGGPRGVGEDIRRCYAPGGAREFDYQLLGSGRLRAALYRDRV